MLTGLTDLALGKEFMVMVTHESMTATREGIRNELGKAAVPWQTVVAMLLLPGYPNAKNSVMMEH
jgi:hypothetical protein